MSTRSLRRAQQDRKNPVSGASTPRRKLSVFLIPLVLALILGLMSFLPRMQENSVLAWSHQVAALALLAWLAVLVPRLKRMDAVRFLVFAPPKPQHYVQALCQLAIFLYWGYFWHPIYDHLWLLASQLVFAYAFEMLLAWSRRESFIPGFGPFPIIFSTNLFLWFRDDWFYLQFLMLAVGFLGKEYVRWNRDGRRVHIFNPSAFSLGVFSLILIATHTTDLTWGPQIASTLTLSPYIYLYIFAVGLIVMYYFSITLVVASAAAVLFGLSALYSATTGVPYFLDSEIPTAVFLGLHLLITDPSTSPRTPPGKLVFGMLYGLGVFGLYTILGAFGAPTFYDKLLVVPLLNLSVQRIDHLVGTLRGRPVLSRLGLDGVRRANLAHMAIWIGFFGVMSALGRTDSRHPGDSLPFWEQACAEGRANGCERLIQLETTYCRDNSGWACNELGGHFAEGTIVPADSDLALGYFSRACDLRFQAGCVNLLDPETVSRANPRPLDLRLLLREGGRNLIDMPEPELYERACEHQWAFACERTAFTPSRESRLRARS